MDGHSEYGLYEVDFSVLDSSDAKFLAPTLGDLLFKGMGWKSVWLRPGPARSYVEVGEPTRALGASLDVAGCGQKRTFNATIQNHYGTTPALQIFQRLARGSA